MNIKSEPGIIYISFLPPRMTVKRIRNIFTRYGEVDRIFLDPEKGDENGYFNNFSHNKSNSKSHSNNKIRNKQYSEGWVEFKNKRKAKKVANMLNGTPIEIHKKRTPYNGMLWNLKYLSGFKWGHLSEQSAYERASKEQALRTEVFKIKRESQNYIEKRENEMKRSFNHSNKSNTEFQSQGNTNTRDTFTDSKNNRIDEKQKQLPTMNFDIKLLLSIFD
ncbi:unnamed protein product [Gordionus sp. m RMFG-2023]